MTSEPYFYRKLYQTRFRGEDKKILQIFGVPTGNAKITRKVQFHLAPPVTKYHQKTSNSFCLSSLAPAFHFINYNRDLLALVNIIEESLTPDKDNCKNGINFANAIISNRRKIKGEQNLRYNMTIWRKNYAFDILNDIGENFTLVQLMDSLGNVNHTIIIVGHWIFDSNYKKALF